MFIGEKEVNEVSVDNETGIVQISFKEKDSSPIKMKKELYEMIQSDQKGMGGVTDMVRAALCSMFVKQMALLGLEYHMIEHVAIGVSTFAHNLREKKMAEKFGVDSVLNIPLSAIIE